MMIRAASIIIYSTHIHGITRQNHLARIDALDKKGPTLDAIIELNPDALLISDRRGAERKAGRIRGQLHGVRCLCKGLTQTRPDTTGKAGQHRRAFDDPFLRVRSTIFGFCPALSVVSGLVCVKAVDVVRRAKSRSLASLGMRGRLLGMTGRLPGMTVARVERLMNPRHGSDGDYHPNVNTGGSLAPRT